jgi:hypothetical protein
VVVSVEPMVSGLTVADLLAHQTAFRKFCRAQPAHSICR